MKYKRKVIKKKTNKRRPGKKSNKMNTVKQGPRMSQKKDPDIQKKEDCNTRTMNTRRHLERSTTTQIHKKQILKRDGKK